MSEITLKKLDEYRWEIPRTGKMNVHGIIFVDEELKKAISQDKSLEQVVNVAGLPGIVKVSLAMPDIHWGYGFPIGGVAAFDVNTGIISPGGVGYDICCGVRLLRTNLKKDEVSGKIKDLIYALFNGIPTGLGSSGAISKLSRSDEQEVIKKGAKWAVEHGFGIKEDLEFIEEYGTMEGADSSLVSDRAYERGKDQVGTLGSGNHFIEVDIVSEIFEPEIAKVFGLEKDKIAVLIHTGSRGFGYQVCDDYLKLLTREYRSFGIELTDRQLACAPIKSKLGQDYYSAMVCAANYARANRQVITHLIRNVFERLFKISPKELGMSLVYDVAHNIAKFEEHEIDGKKIKVCVHRKGATRAFPANRPEVPSVYRSVGQPVLIPGDMGRSSFVLVGTDKALEETFGSTCHGAGRVMSRHAAMSQSRGKSITRELEEKGIVVIAREKGTLAEEMSEAYKNIEDVIDVVISSGISKKVAKLRPIGVIKG